MQATDTMRFDLDDLRLFVAAADTGSLTAAAGQRHLSLAAASARIQGLERQTGLALLRREARGVRLLPPGEAFLHHARLILAESAALRVSLAEYSANLRARLRVFANTTAVTEFLPELLPRFLATHPRIDVDLQEKPNARIPQGVLAGQADLGIVAGRVDTLGLQSLHLSTDRLVLVTARDHRFARRRRIAFVDTLTEDAVGMLPESTLQTFLRQITDSLGRPQRLRVQLSSFEAMCRMISGGVGIGILPESAALRHREQLPLALVDLTDDWCVRERTLVMRDAADRSPHADALVEVLLDHFRPQQKPAAAAKGRPYITPKRAKASTVLMPDSIARRT